MKRLLAVFLLAAPAYAQSPSFDCTKASSETEKTICKEENADLADRDAAAGRLFTSLQNDPDAKQVLADQASWIKARDKCGANAECIRKRYDERLSVLARAAGDTGGITGNYAYSYSEDTNQGSAHVVREADGTLSAYISTVSGQGYHLCEYSVDAAEPIGDAWLWTSGKEDSDEHGNVCRILIRQKNANAIVIDSIYCRSYCGANGHFDDTYTRVK